MKTELTKAFTWLWLCLLSLIAISSCSSRPHIDCRLVEAEHIINAHPDSALQLVRGIRPRTSVDSAYAVYLTARAKDKLHIRDVDVDSLQEAVDYLETLPLADEEKALMHYYTGINHYRKDSLRRSVQEYYKCLDYQTDTCTRIGFKTYENLGDCFFYGSLFKEAVEYYLTALSITTALNDSLGMCIVDEEIAFTYCVLDRYDSALEFSNQAILINEARADSLHLSISYNSRAVILDAMGKSEEALQYSNKAFSTNPEKEAQLSFYITRCDIWMHLNRWDSVDVCLRHWQEYSTNKKHLDALYDRYYQRSKQDSISPVQTLYADSALFYQAQRQNQRRISNQELLKVYDSYQAETMYRFRMVKGYVVLGIFLIIIVVIFLYYRSYHIKKNEKKTATFQQPGFQETPPEDLSMLLILAKERLLSSPDFVDLKSQNNYSSSAIQKEELKKLNAAILSSFSQVNMVLQNKYPMLGDANQFFCVLSYLGYKTHIKSILMECSESALYQRKYRVSTMLTPEDARLFF